MRASQREMTEGGSGAVVRTKRPLWRRLLFWLTVLTAVPFVCLFAGTGIANHFRCQLNGDPPHGPPCTVRGVNIEPAASFLEDTGEGVLLTIVTIPVVAVGWIVVAVQTFARRRDASG